MFALCHVRITSNSGIYHCHFWPLDRTRVGGNYRTSEGLTCQLRSGRCTRSRTSHVVGKASFLFHRNRQVRPANKPRSLNLPFQPTLARGFSAGLRRDPIAGGKTSPAQKWGCSRSCARNSCELGKKRQFALGVGRFSAMPAACVAVHLAVRPSSSF